MRADDSREQDMFAKLVVAKLVFAWLKIKMNSTTTRNVSLPAENL